MSELEYLKNQHKLGRLSRREFMGRSAALGASAATIATMVAEVDAHAEETPKSGGTLKLGLGGGSTTDSVDVTSYNDSVMIDTSPAIFNSIVEWGHDGKTKPELAESWEAKPGAQEWIFNLRKDVKFHNGKAMTADDVIYSLNLHRGESKSGGAAAIKNVKDIKKLTDNQISILLESADADFTYNLTDYHMKVVPNGFTDWANPIGTGAYTIEKFEPGVRVLLKKANGDYWKKDRGHADSIEITVINDGAARLNAVISGQVDAINRVDPKAVGLLQKSSKLDLVRAPGGWHTVMAMTVDQAPYTNADLRLAMKYAMDREQIMKALFQGYGQIGNDHPIPKTDPYFNTELAVRKHDPDKATFYFKKAGLTDPKIVLQVSDAAFNGAVDMATLLQSSCQKSGIPMDVKKESADGFWSNVWLKGAFVASYWGGRAAATQMLDTAYQAKAAWNETHWNNEKFEKLLRDAKAETDEAKRKSYIWEMQAMLSDEGGALIPVFKDWLQAGSKKIGGLAPTSGFDMNNGYVCEQAWVKA
ncbi:ABC transporter substrate-binding protein [Methylovirgula sp. 4M-Z18]|uniref:ABC transporter substrate-binding protein n=1 Tax=Methylovirgula sp. 4M-Z18 TaxID=2293567 RepID=UPI001314B5F6|nr:ABC transporter substrate-binding protein [Methylovirgula sp. 4M-Z18]